MKDPSKTNQELLEQISLLKERIEKLEQSEETRKQAEAALRTSEAKLKEIFETIDDLYYEVDSEDVIKLLSPSVSRLTGWNAEDLVGKPVTTVYADPLDRERLLSKMSEKGYIHDYELLLKRRDGEKRHASLSAHLVIDDNGRPIGVRGLLRDITERKQAEDRGIALNNLYRQLLSESDLTQKIQWISDAVAQTLGADFARIWVTKSGDLCERGCSQASVKDGPNVCRDRTSCLHLVASSGRYTHIDGEHRRVPIGAYKVGRVASGEWSHFVTNDVTHDERVHNHEWAYNLGLVSFAGYRLLSSDGRPVGVLAMFSRNAITSDQENLLENFAAITSQIIITGTIEETLRESEEKFRVLAESTPTAIMMYQNNKYVYANPAAERISGYSLEELVTMDFWAFIHPDYRHLVQERGQKRQTGESTVSRYEFKIVTKDGTEKWVDLSGAPMMRGGSPAGIISVMDITDRKRVQEELQESKELYTRLVDTIPDIIVRTDLEGTILFVNDYTLQISGYNRDELEGQNILTFVSPEDRDSVMQNSLLMMENRLGPKEYHLIMKDGRKIPFEVNGDVLRSENGTPFGIVNVCRDITERKHAEEALKASEEKYRKIFEDATEGIYQTTPEGRYLSMNLAFAKMFGYASPQEMIDTVTNIGQQLYVNPKEREEMARTLRKHNKVDGFEAEVYHKDRSRFWISINMHIVRDASGNILYFEGTTQDITERKQAEKEILNERSKLKTLSDNAPFGMVLIDKEGYYTYINKKFTELFGYDLSDTPDGRTWFRKAYPETEYRHTVIATWKEDWGSAKPGTSTPRIFSVICKDGTQKVVNFITSALVSGDYLMVCEDITELRRLENQLRQAQKTEALGTLAGGIAHDFNNILTALMGYAALLQMSMDTSDPLRPYVDQILVASQKAVDLTQSLLTFSRQQSITLVPLNMNNTIKAARKLLRRLLTEDIELRISLTNDDTVVMADKSQMDQILFNLVTNARDAMPKGGVLTIETASIVLYDTFVKTHGFGEAGKYLEITVSDTGVGMDETTKGKIFDPFFTTK